jgi:hypothetical protein
MAADNDVSAAGPVDVAAVVVPPAAVVIMSATGIVDVSAVDLHHGDVVPSPAPVVVPAAGVVGAGVPMVLMPVVGAMIGADVALLDDDHSAVGPDGHDAMDRPVSVGVHNTSYQPRGRSQQQQQGQHAHGLLLEMDRVHDRQAKDLQYITHERDADLFHPTK